MTNQTKSIYGTGTYCHKCRKVICVCKKYEAALKRIVKSLKRLLLTPNQNEKK